MANQHGSPFGHSLAARTHAVPPRRSSNYIELGLRASSVSTTNTPYPSRRWKNNQAVIENSLAHFTDEELERDVREFQETCLPSVKLEQLLRAARVAKDIRTYDAVARSNEPHAAEHLLVQLTPEEKVALRREMDALPSEPTMLIVILTVSLAAFLQGFVQSSINGASLFASEFGLNNLTSVHNRAGSLPPKPTSDDWKLGAVNASPYLFAALIGCWLALPINDRVGRRGAMATAACLIFASSLGAAYSLEWKQLFGVRILNGLGMGMKAVSTPILASETAVGYWRGTSILAWQLWVAFGIAIGFAFNLIFLTAPSDETTLRLILAAPFVPSIALLVSLYFCPESPRYYLRQRTANFNPSKAYAILVKLRRENLQALRDIYLIYRSVRQEEYSDQPETQAQGNGVPRGFAAHVKAYANQYRQLFTKRRLRNALISSSIVALAQQLCGINVFAFYSGKNRIITRIALTLTRQLAGYIGIIAMFILHGPLFNGVLNSSDPLQPMLYSFGYGAVNFLFGLPAIRTIDTLGRRKWLVLTLPLMGLFMTAAALSTLLPDGNQARGGVIALFVYLFAVAYSPGMGPIPFTLASESFPLSHREAGCAFAVATNLLFAGLLSILFPSIYAGLGNAKTLGLFAGLNFVAFVLVFLFVEETKRRSLEDLDSVFAVKKWKFTRHQVTEYLPWFFGSYLLGRDNPRPEFYLDLIWGDHRDPAGHNQDSGAESGANRHSYATAGGVLFNPSAPFDNGTNPEYRRPNSSGSDDSDHR
ncbi:major facilitator superfamily domain-containing protein [Xylariaceae sp. FL1651]|nr:major facilitator superfamily domain-containing protein [Xylariaceae sp. FL1651]